MNSYHEYWSFAAVRGVLALLAAAVVVALPRAVADLFTLPVILTFSIAAFALWAVFDSATTILLAQLFPEVGRKTLAVQSAAAFAIAALVFLTGYRVLPAQSLVWLVAALAAITALTEYRLARTAHQTYNCLSCYTTTFAYAAAAVAFPFAANLTAEDMTLALGAFLGFIGSSQLAVGGRMLLLGYRENHPALQYVPADWRFAMEPATQLAPAASQPCPGELICQTCPAAATCLDDSLSGKLTEILRARRPAIVNCLRAQTLLAQR